MSTPEDASLGDGGTSRLRLEPSGISAADRETILAAADALPLAEDDIGVADDVDTRDQFGAFNRSFRWLPPATSTGHIVQRIDRVERVFNPDGSPAAALTATTRYWEAWRVLAGQVLNPAGAPITAGSHDSWFCGTNPDRYGRYGDWRITGTVYWLPQGAPLPAAFQAGGVPEAGGLLSTAVDPHLTEGDVILQHHRAGAWDSRLEAAARELLTGWHADDMLDSTPAETEEEIVQSHRFSAVVAHAAVSWAQAQGWFPPT